MTSPELEAFLGRTRPALLGVVGTLREDGSPHVVPVWYRWDGQAALIWTDERRGWVRNAVRDSRVAFSVQEIQPPFAAVVMHGRVEVRTSDDDATAAEIRRITAPLHRGGPRGGVHRRLGAPADDRRRSSRAPSARGGEGIERRPGRPRGDHSAAGRPHARLRGGRPARRVPGDQLPRDAVVSPSRRLGAGR